MALPKQPEDQTIYRRFRAARRLAEVSTVTASHELGISRSTLHRMETGAVPLPAPYLLWATVVWGAPASLLDVADLALAPQGDPLRGLEDLVQSLQAERQPLSPEAPAVGGGKRR